MSQKSISIVFTGDEFADGADHILTTLRQNGVPASFFLTGKFYSNPQFGQIIADLKKDGHYLGPHSDQHLLYADWRKRDSLLVTRKQFVSDLSMNYRRMRKFGIKKSEASYFLPPYEWYNSDIVRWTRKLNLHLINFTPGTRSAADYTYPGMASYRSSDEIYQSIMDYERKDPDGLNGFILLMHIGTDPKRTDKFYYRLDKLIKELKSRGYTFMSVNNLIEN